MNKLNYTKRAGIEGHDFDTLGKTITKALTGFAEEIVAQPDRLGDEKVRCGKCGTAGVKLYSGGKGRLLSMCAECLWPQGEKTSSDADVVTGDVDSVQANTRVIRLVHCYACRQPRPQSAMSQVPVICRACLANDGSRQAKLRIERGILRISRAIRRWAACI